MFEQAEYWRSRGQPDRVLAAVRRILLAVPDEPDALTLAIEAAAQTSSVDAAREFLERLRRVAPGNDQRTRRAEVSISVASTGGAALAEARRLAAAGRRPDAVRQYRELFRGNQAPPYLELEFYEVLAGTDENGYAEAIAGLRRIAASRPNDTQLSLKLATQLSYREGTRDEAIEMLQRLSRLPAAQAAARQQLRETYMWEPGSPGLATQIEELLQFLPGDRELEAKLAEARTSRRSAILIDAWELVNRNRIGEAERQFRQVLAETPDDPETMVSLAVIAARQGRVAEARALRVRAIALAPEREAEFMAYTTNIEGGDVAPTGAGGGRRVAARGGGYAPPPSLLARQALERGQTDLADQLARRAARGRGDDAAQGSIVLGQIALRRDDPEEAERRFRASLLQRPGDAEATQGLYFALLNQDRFAEAEDLQRRSNLAVPPGSQSRRAFSLREQALRTGDDQVAIATLQEAVRIDPGNVFVRLDLARRLRRAGQIEASRLMEAQLVNSGQPEALAAAALLAADDERFGDAAANLALIPDRVRSGEVNRQLSQFRFEAQVRGLESGARLGDAESREALARLAMRPDPSGAAATNVARAFGRLNDREAALAATRAGLRFNPQLDASARIGLASALIEMQALAEGEEILQGAERTGRLSAEDTRQVAFLRETTATSRAGQRLVQEDVDGARAELLPHLRGPVASPQVLTALMRTHTRMREYPEAMRIAQELLSRDPLDGNIRASAVDLAVEMKEYGRAEALLAEGRRFEASSVDLLRAEARVARARNNPVRELRALEAATRLRMEQLRLSGQAQQAALAGEFVSPNRAGAQKLTDVADPATVGLLRQLSLARDEAAGWIQAGIGLNSRTGAAGISRSTTITTPLEASLPVPGLQGRLAVHTGTVTMIPGAISTDTLSLRQFGTNPLAGTRIPGRPEENRTGVPLGLSYTAQRLRADLGTTPLGFRRTNVVGGVEVQVPLADRVSLRLTAERRSISDTLLSYGGLRDPLSGREWGGVVRSGGRAQVEAQLTEKLGAYALIGGAAINGRGVRDNAVLEAGAGLYRNMWDTPGSTLSLGLDFRHSAFSQNLGFATLGHGGYFSPQRSNAVSVQADYRKQVGDLTLRAVASVGWQRYYARTAPLFPNDPGLQAQVRDIANTTENAAFYPTQRASGPTGSLFLNAEYALAPQWRVGAAARFNRSGDFENLSGLFYLRYRIEPAARDIAPLLTEAPRATPFGSSPFAGGLVQGRPEPVMLPATGSRPIW